MLEIYQNCRLKTTKAPIRTDRIKKNENYLELVRSF